MLTTINEQSQVLSPSNLLALQRQSTGLSISQPRLNYTTASPVQRGISPESDLEVGHVLQQQTTSMASSSKTLVPTVSVGKTYCMPLQMHDHD